MLSKFSDTELIKRLDISFHDVYKYDLEKVKNFFNRLGSDSYYIIAEYDYSKDENYLRENPYIYYGNDDLVEQLDYYNFLASSFFIQKEYDKAFYLYDNLIKSSLEVKDDQYFDTVDYVSYDSYIYYLNLKEYTTNFYSEYMYLALVTNNINVKNIIVDNFSIGNYLELLNILKLNNDSINKYSEVFKEVVTELLLKEHFYNYKEVMLLVKEISDLELDEFIKSYANSKPLLMKEYIIYNDNDDNLIKEALKLIDVDNYVRGDIANLSKNNSFLKDSFISNPSLNSFFNLTKKYSFNEIQLILNEYLRSIKETDLRYNESLFKYLKLFNYDYEVLNNFKYKRYYKTTGRISFGNLIVLITLIPYVKDNKLLMNYLSNKLGINDALLINYFNEWTNYYNYNKELNDKLLEGYIVNIEDDMLKSNEAYYYEYSVLFINYSYYLERTANISSESYLESIINKHKYRKKLKNAINEFINLF